MEEDEEERWWNFVWSATLFGTLIVVFFPWSLLVMTFFYGWERTVVILRALFNVAWAILGSATLLVIIILLIFL